MIMNDVTIQGSGVKGTQAFSVLFLELFCKSKITSNTKCFSESSELGEIESLVQGQTVADG